MKEWIEGARTLAEVHTGWGYCCDSLGKMQSATVLYDSIFIAVISLYLKIYKNMEIKLCVEHINFE